jgi:hypothetical protein
MRRSLVGALLCAGFVIAVTAWPGSSESALDSPLNGLPAAQSNGLVMHVAAADSQSQVVTVIDPQQRVLAVYFVDRASGKIVPKSIRNITWDLQMIEFNSGDPLPQDIRNGLQR